MKLNELTDLGHALTVIDAKDAEIEWLRAALEQVVKIAQANGMQSWKMTKVAEQALCQQSTLTEK